MKHYLIIDLGTGNSRVALTNETGDLLDVRTFENVYYIDDRYDDAQYFEPGYWKRKLLELCVEIIQDHPDITIDAMSSSGARETIVLIDEDGEDFYGLPNIDNRGREWIHEVDKSGIYEKTGRWVTEDFPAAKLLGLKKRRPEIYKRVETFTSLSEWIGYVLCGNVVIEPSQACETQLYDSKENCWSDEIIERFTLQGIQMPYVQSAGSLMGYVSKPMKELLGITYDIPFVVGGADTQVAVLGAGIKEGDIGIVSGTTSPVVTVVKERYCDAYERCWTDSFLKGELYMIETNPGVTGLNYQRIRNLLFDSVGYDDLEAALQEIKDVKCTASFSSLDFEHACGYKNGGFFMRPPFRADLHRADLAWAVVGDIACSIYYQYKQLLNMVPIDHERILGCGGGFRSEVLAQHIADLSGKKLCLPMNFHQASIGGCILLLNEYMGISKEHGQIKYTVYEPRENTLIHEYYELWKINRDRVNKTN